MTRRCPLTSPARTTPRSMTSSSGQGSQHCCSGLPESTTIFSSFREARDRERRLAEERRAQAEAAQLARAKEAAAEERRARAAAEKSRKAAEAKAAKRREAAAAAAEAENQEK